MNKTIIAIFFSVLFSVLTIAPNVMAVIDHDYDLSILIDSSEEEETKGEGKEKDFKIEIPLNKNTEYISFNELAKLLQAYSENYNSLFKELTSPPPERI